MRLSYVIMFLITAQIYSQNLSDRVLYDVNKVYVQLNEYNSEELISTSEKLLLLKSKNDFSVWSARDKRKMYDFTIDGEEIKAQISPNSENIIFFIKKEGVEKYFVGNLILKSGVYHENRISNKNFKPLDFKSKIKFNPDNKDLSIFSNNKLWSFNIEKFDLKEVYSFDENLEDNYKDFLFITENHICFKIESDIKQRYFNTQLRPSEWKLDSLILFNKKTRNIAKVKLEESAAGVYKHRGNKVIVDYKDKISSLDVFNLEEKNYPKKSNKKVYKTLLESDNTLVFLGDRNLKKANKIKTDSLSKAFKKSKEESFDLYLSERNLSPTNLVQIDKINKNFKYIKSKKLLPMNNYWNPCVNYFNSNYGVVYSKSNGIFSYYSEIYKSQRWNIDYTRENLQIYEGLTLNNKGDFTFFGYDRLQVLNLTNDKIIEEKANLKVKSKFYLQNQNVLTAYIKNEKKKKLIQLELKNEKGNIIWESEFIDSKIKNQINLNIYLNHTQTKAFLNISPLYYDKNYESYSYNIDLENNKISEFKFKNGAYITENYSYINSLGDSFMVYNNFNEKEQTIQNKVFLTTLKNDNIIYQDNNKEGFVLKGKVTDNGILQNYKYSLPKKVSFQFNSSPFSFIKSKNLLAGVSNKYLNLWELEKESPIKRISLNYDSATYIANSEKQLFVYYTNGFIDVVDLESLEIITSFSVHKKNENVYKAFFNDDLKFFIPKDIIKEYHFVKGFETFPLVSYELFLNRPDIILSKLGYTDPALVEVYKKAYLKRLKNSGFSEKTDYLEIKKPKISLTNRNVIKSISKTNTLRLDFEAETKLDSLFIYVNGVPILKNKPLKNVFEESITLGNGLNKIAILAINKQGIQSESINLEVTYANDEKPTVHYFGIGVSKYADASMNLKYADIDVRSLSKLFKTKFEGRIQIDTLNNTNATKENILAFKKKLANTNINDIVIISFSGHGLVDEVNDFYFATHNIDFNEPSIKGLAYSDIQQLVENIPARKKLLLIDACHSGELDAEEIKEPEVKSENVTAYLPEGVKGTVIKKKKSGFKTSFEIMKSSFNNYDRGNGSFVISAAGGKEYAFESKEWGNGVFTYSFIKALEDLKFDKYNNKQSITISMLKNYIYQNVIKLTKNQQKPTSRSDNLELDWFLCE